MGTVNCFCAETIIGAVTIYANEKALTGVYFGECLDATLKNAETEIIKKAFVQLHEYLNGSRTRFDLKLEYVGSDFQMLVWNQLKKIPYGKTKTYKEIARNVNNPKSSLAVGGACGRNPISIFIPCHRVIGSNGNLTGYGGGLHIKKHLLEMEKQYSNAANSSF
ncbi:MAG: methylated-DNA--[protein]-cysteine S-methyltransferase [Holosporaceae bacterium]|jgi:methylated-DNA-[protein]-cysteine S-methyltransferase|nr:methylated-DNA--[protein]-cysteine S-methyltransferase [Holosporaceae bacterium]